LLGPLFVREWLTVPRRPRHYLTRAAYLLGLLILGLTAWHATLGWDREVTLGDTARFGGLIFRLFVVAQLTLVLFFSALAAASAVALEKDRRTFILLLITDLRNYEIVLGKLFGSLLQIGLLLAAVVPVLFLLVLLGGVAFHQVTQTVVVLAATALAAGSLGSLMALWRERTFQALALTVLFLVLYLCVVEGLAFLPPIALGTLGELNLAAARSWLDPFRAIEAALSSHIDTGAVLPTAYAFGAAMVLWAVLLNAVGIWRLRVWNPSGEPIMQRELPGNADDEKDRLKAHAAPGAVRTVGANPILWREIFTRAYGRRPLLIKVAYYLVVALICFSTLPSLWNMGAGHPWNAAAFVIVPVGVLSLLLVSAQAVTAITSERDTGALDLLLVTDLSPKEFIFGKLGGILYNTKDFLWPPLVLAALCAWRGLLATPPRAYYEELVGPRNFEAAFCLIGAALVLLAFAMVLGIHVALRTGNSRLAVVNTLGTLFFLTVGTLICIYLILINRRFESQWASFILFLVAGILGLWWVLSGDRPSAALTLASGLCPVFVFYAVVNLLVGKPGTDESSDPLMPFLVIVGAFGFTIAAMLIPLISEFDVALGRTTGGAD
jgi:ABC-type transport system involved in multi-copper enzyme maturation permease subunit